MSVLTQVAPTRSQNESVATIHRSLVERDRKVRLRVWTIIALALAFCVFFMLYDALDSWALVAPIRFAQLTALAVVAVALASATVVFQAVTRNRILSPNVMGFDSMFQLISTLLVFILGAHFASQIPSMVIFVIQATMMTLLAVGMFMYLLGRNRRSVHLLVLFGIVIGTFLRSITLMLTAIMDPNEYLVVQAINVASFSMVTKEALIITAVLTVLVNVVIFARSKTLDLLYLGPDLATSLGIDYKKEVKIALGLSAILVACATALVGPMMFFGLLVVNIAVFTIGSSKIQFLLPAASALGLLVLAGGQAVLKHVFEHATILPIILEFVGGALLLVMIIKESRK